MRARSAVRDFLRDDSASKLLKVSVLVQRVCIHAHVLVRTYILYMLSSACERKLSAYACACIAVTPTRTFT